MTLVHASGNDPVNDEGGAPVGAGSDFGGFAERVRLALTHFEDLIGYQAMGLAMNRIRCLCAWRIDETKDLACLLVDPVALVIDTMRTLDFDVLGVGAGDIRGGHPTVHVVHIHIKRHIRSPRFVPPVGDTFERRTALTQPQAISENRDCLPMSLD